MEPESRLVHLGPFTVAASVVLLMQDNIITSCYNCTNQIIARCLGFKVRINTVSHV